MIGRIRLGRVLEVFVKSFKVNGKVWRNLIGE